jgi:hypothetical protein
VPSSWDSRNVGALLEPVPFGYCHCRCGGLAPIATKTNRSKGWVKDQPKRFIKGHNAWRRRGGVEMLQAEGRWGYHFTKEDAERFWKFVDRTTTPDGCWTWTGQCNRQGYGRIKVNGRTRQATHIALELSGFIVPAKRLQVRHYICDNPPCCRPSHMKIGTHQEDRDDMTGKGRQARGERHGQAKLTAGDVRLVRATVVPDRKLAKLLGVSEKTIRNIRSGKKWRHFPTEAA